MTSPPLSLADRFRRLPPAAREAFLASLPPGWLSDLRYEWEGFWARPDQLVAPEVFAKTPIVVFTGERGAGKTRAANQLWLREVLAGRFRRPRIVASTEADIAKVVVGWKESGEPDDGILACLPREDRPRFLADEGPAGVLRFKNGTEAICFSAKVAEGMVSYQGDGDLLDDVAKWGVWASQVWFHQQASCRKGQGVTIVATTRRGTDLLRGLLGHGPGGTLPGVLILRPPTLDANKHNLTAGLRKRVKAVAGGKLAQQDIDDEDISASSPFAGIDFDAEPVRILSVNRHDFEDVIVAVDEAGGKGGDHDEWGIGAAAKRNDGHTLILEDGSGSYSDDEAGERILQLAERWGATKIVAEKNRGDRVMTVIRSAWWRRIAEKRQGKLRALPELVPVVAKEGKKIRAGETRSLYLGGLVHHLPGLGVLDKRGIEERSAEKQMREWDPGAPKRARADDRIDWIVHAIHALGSIAEEIPTPPEDVERDTDWGEESRYASVAYEDRGYR